MKTTVIESSKANVKVNSTAVNGKADNKGAQSKTNGLAVSKKLEDKEKSEAEAPVKDNGQPQEQAGEIITETPKAEEPKAEPIKEEAKEEKQQKPALNLESTLKLVEELHRRKIQRDRLLDTIDTLEAFEVAQIDDADETEANHFQGCVLTIEDDNRRKFTTKNPVIIQAVAQFVNTMCVNRLAEIEVGIIIPA